MTAPLTFAVSKDSMLEEALPVMARGRDARTGVPRQGQQRPDRCHHTALDFMKRSSFIALDRASLDTIGPAAVILARAEGLPGHAESIELRLQE